MNNRIYVYPNKNTIGSIIKDMGPDLLVYVKILNKQGFRVVLKRALYIKNIEFIYLPSQLEQLLDVMGRLRSNKGCPWDKEQTHESLLPYLLEEANEYCDAVASKDMNKVLGELGDLLLQIVFHSQIAKERGVFNLEDVAKAIKDKLIFRHPHIFSGNSKEVTDPNEVELIWQQQKKKEKTESSSLISLPPILRIEKNIDMLKKQNKFVDLDKNMYKGGLLQRFLKEDIDTKAYGQLFLELIILGKVRGINTTFELLNSIKSWEETINNS